MFCQRQGRKPYECGVKELIIRYLKERLVIGVQTLREDVYDGHSLWETLRRTDILIDVRPHAAYVDSGHHGHGIGLIEMYISGQKCGVIRSINRKLKRRSKGLS